MARIGIIKSKGINFPKSIKPNPKNIKDDIIKIFEMHLWEMNSRYSRQTLCNQISNYLHKEIIDKTTNKEMNNNIYNFIIMINNKEMPLMTYADNIISMDRRDKILNIKRKMKYDRLG